jgi:SAM-dependent MidA family methyltransferase
MGHKSDFKPDDVSQNGLPTPDAVSQAHSTQLQRMIAEEAAIRGGRLTFARYMEMALYAPGLGYYSSGSYKLGAEGDFITAPECSPLFSRCLARQVMEVLEALQDGDVLEVGGGSGIMAADMLEFLLEKDCLPRRYYILERSGDLRARQQALLKKRLPQIQDRIIWLERLPEPGFCGVIVANELLDALPVHCFTITSQGAVELYVERKDDQWRWCRDKPSSPELAERIENLQLRERLPVGYSSEINLAAEAWIGSIADILAKGALLVIDYGFPRSEYYHPERSEGTLMCHYRHRAHDDPLILVGLQDITAHIDFTAIAEAGYAANLKVAGYTTQAGFLLAAGITEFINEIEDETIRLQCTQQIKKLTLPHEMGELFKVLAFTRDLDQSLMGFAVRDLRRRL